MGTPPHRKVPAAILTRSDFIFGPSPFAHSVFFPWYFPWLTEFYRVFGVLPGFCTEFHHISGQFPTGYLVLPSFSGFVGLDRVLRGFERVRAGLIS